MSKCQPVSLVPHPKFRNHSFPDTSHALYCNANQLNTSASVADMSHMWNAADNACHCSANPLNTSASVADMSHTWNAADNVCYCNANQLSTSASAADMSHMWNMSRLDSPLAHVLPISIMPHTIPSVERAQMPSIRGRGRVGLGWGVYLSLPCGMSFGQDSFSVWTCSEVDLGPSSSLSLCLSLVSGLVLWTGSTLVCIKVCVCDLYSSCLLLSLLSFSFLWEGGYTIRPALTVAGDLSFRVRRSMLRNEGKRGRGIIMGSSSFMLFVWGYEIVVNRVMNCMCRERERESPR
jgi:hypothetical protein